MTEAGWASFYSGGSADDVVWPYNGAPSPESSQLCLSRSGYSAAEMRARLGSICTGLERQDMPRQAGSLRLCH